MTIANHFIVAVTYIGIPNTTHKLPTPHLYTGPHVKALNFLIIAIDFCGSIFGYIIFLDSGFLNGGSFW